MSEHHDERFMQELNGAARAWRAAFERQLKANGLTAAGWSALAAVAAGGEAPSQRALAGQLGVDGATLVATIDRLAARGLVQRTAASHDRRIKLIVATAAGRTMTERMQRETHALRRRTLEGFDRERLAAAADVLAALRRELEGA
jgi:MarR family transcriptional regulator, transcriptional regulator for hemolysin